MSQKTMTAGRAEQLQFLRFLAFLNIFIWHAEAWNFFGYPAGNSANFAVSFFFCLSGLVTGYAYYGREIRVSLAAIGRDMGRKLRKLYPLYFVTMLIPVVHSGIPELIAEGAWEALRGELTQLGKNLLLIQSWFPEGHFSFNIVGWFLSSLLFLNLFNLPVLFLLNKINRLEKRYWIFGGLFLCTVLGAYFYCGITRSLDLRYWHYVFPPARLGEYLAGMVLGFGIRGLASRVPNGKRTEAFFTAAEVGVLCLWWVYLSWWGSYWTTQSVHWMVPNLVLLGVFLLGRGWVSKLLRWRPLVWLGDIAFECYLIHELIVMRYEILHGEAVAEPLGQAVALVFCLALTIAAAALVHQKKA